MSRASQLFFSKSPPPPPEARAASIQVKGGFGGQAVRDYGSLGGGVSIKAEFEASWYLGRLDPLRYEAPVCWKWVS
ncbi:MAG: hypothetical protein RIS36_551 [Pseudomonadota bacterium]